MCEMFKYRQEIEQKVNVVGTDEIMKYYIVVSKKIVKIENELLLLKVLNKPGTV